MILFIIGFAQSVLTSVFMYAKPKYLNHLEKAERGLMFVLISILILVIGFSIIEKETVQKLKLLKAIVIGSITISIAFTLAHLFWYLLGYLDKSFENFVKQTFFVFMTGIILSILAYIIVRLRNNFLKKHCA